LKSAPLTPQSAGGRSQTGQSQHSPPDRQPTKRRAPNVTAVLSLARLGAGGLGSQGECGDNRQREETKIRAQLNSIKGSEWTLLASNDPPTDPRRYLTRSTG